MASKPTPDLNKSPTKSDNLRVVLRRSATALSDNSLRWPFEGHIPQHCAVNFRRNREAELH